MVTEVDKDKNAKLQAYIKQVLAIRDKQEQFSLSQEDFKRIAKNMGIRDEELQQAEEEFRSSYIRGAGYLKIEHWQEAINELNVAVALSFENKEALIALANAYFGFWKQTSNIEYKKLALTLSKQCLEIEPQFQAAFDLLAQIKKETKKTINYKVNTAIFILIISVVIIGRIFLTGEITDNTQISSVIRQSEQIGIEVEETDFQAESDGQSVQERCFDIGLEKELPIIWEESDATSLNINTVSSVIIYYKEAISYKLNGTLAHHSTTLFKLNIKIKLMATDDRVVSEKIIKAISYHPPHIPDDAIPISESIFIKNKQSCIKEAKLSIDYIEQNLIAKPITTRITPIWKPNTVPLNIEILKRNEQLSYNEIFKENQYKLILGVKNHSDHTITQLKLNTEFYKKGQLVKPIERPLSQYSKEGKNLVRKSGPPMLENEQRVISFSHSFKEHKPFDEVKVVIVKTE